MSGNEAVRFFYQHAGYSYTPNTETRDQGRRRNARNMAAAEHKAKNEGCAFEWGTDDTDSSDWSNERPSWPQFYCVMKDADGKHVASLFGIDFGRDAEPEGPYRRVVEAELACEWQAMPRCKSCGRPL